MKKFHFSRKRLDLSSNSILRVYIQTHTYTQIYAHTYTLSLSHLSLTCVEVENAEKEFKEMLKENDVDVDARWSKTSEV